MTDAVAIAEILGTYRKYGWLLRRVLLTPSLSDHLAEAGETLFGNTKIIDSTIDAAWFSRPPASGGVTWEIRNLGDIPFALVEKLDEDDPGFESMLRDLEIRLSETVSKKLPLDNRAV